MVESSLKHCPFCDSLATYVWDDASATWTVGCTNKNCITYVNTTIEFILPVSNSNIEKVGKKWNERVELINDAKKANEKTHWYELFGTLERAAKMLSIDDMNCKYCLLKDHCKNECLIKEQDRLLKWLRGDV